MATILKQKLKTFFVPTAITLLLSACNSTSLFENSVTYLIKQEAYASSEFYINKAEQTLNSQDKITYQLLAVRKLIDENKVVEAQNTLNDLTTRLNIMEQNPLQQLEYQLVTAQLAALKGNNHQAEVTLQHISAANLSHSQLLRFYQTQAKIAENSKNTIEAVRIRSLIATQLVDNKLRQENNDKIWSLLRNANRGMLSSAQAGAGEMELAGWLALIEIYNQSVSTPAQMPQNINYWKRLYPNHSALAVMPTELQRVFNFQQTLLNNVALLLPLSGDAKILGEIIKKGFDDAKEQDPTIVQVFDTDSNSIENILMQAKQQGAQMIIGPLLKSRVNQMLASDQIRDINVLALNATQDVKPIVGVCYYGLSPEAEARSGADRLSRDGYTKAIVVAARDEFGQRSAEAFAQRWRQLTNTDADIRYYNQPLDVITTIQNSANNLQETALYALGNAEQLLEIKQGLENSTIAGQLAIYTASRSNSPNNGIEFRTAMEGVKFSEIPLLADHNSNEYQKAYSLADSDFSMMRLYAMGSDTWALANKFNEFRQIPGYSISGLTGNLNAGPNCNIERNMTWLQYHNGAVETTN
ncbi:penicillin-binding protein [[Haemophilus] ducreyi]|uniref:Penicillin-binding protein activator LpoA n=2 Tax=Haemophilus ducreyi TaxID=730 RepID=LPOA_HAEDU|nr:penicillin-binding protein activator [[Haemophilus] ducreyi]Q7VMZ8.1 RecName: Full=Penicillin-binding protein activator LpoA; Short=PBP activator LpoA; Flags: Precursor [[Haemophilus] ducreyi 35000HP]AAP95703.1 lipoprotein C-like protein [[Haemophilus] ducreyi 35000HP]AKO30763.1 penicillin-binding protein [[Haemophilus] ducreyi]AKO32201.1 penicillin-binding protein [[Haemophilus] ducreyi]AKO33655.1 penicillin-binding protein [[Haemophilus] ducreyi]AKO35102.1 penicillin-binding protein [[Ha